MLSSRSRAVALGGAVVLALGIVLAMLSLPAGVAAPEDPAAARAVRALTSEAADHALAAVPGDFAAVEGYRPVVRGGVLLRPDGSCSSPVPLPRGFTPSCDRHDLGYDLLRYAAVKGHPLRPWARVAIDRQLGAGLRAACARAGGVGCGLAAAMAYVAVRANSRRQGDEVPGPENPATVGAAALGGVGALSLLGLTMATLLGRVRRCALRPGPPRFDLARGL